MGIDFDFLSTLQFNWYQHGEGLLTGSPCSSDDRDAPALGDAPAGVLVLKVSAPTSRWLPLVAAAADHLWSGTLKPRSVSSPGNLSLPLPCSLVLGHQGQSHGAGFDLVEKDQGVIRLLQN